MVLTVTLLSSVILGATTIAGLLMLYQLRQSTNVSDSASAVYAADAGLEYEFFRLYKNPAYSAPIFLNSASVTTTVNGTTSVQSVGRTGNVARAFEANL